MQTAITNIIKNPPSYEAYNYKKLRIFQVTNDSSTDYGFTTLGNSDECISTNTLVTDDYNIFSSDDEDWIK